MAAYYRLPPRISLRVRTFASTTSTTPGFSYAEYLAEEQRSSQSQLRGGRKDGVTENEMPFNWLLQERPRKAEAEAFTM